MNNVNPSRIEHLHECLQQEVMMSSKPFSWFRVVHKAVKCPDRRFHFWWRIASYWYTSDSNFLKARARGLNRKLISKYGADIQLSAHIGPGMVITHYQGIVINGSAVIGRNFRIRQNVTIGITGTNRNKLPISLKIGDNVTIGANSCVIGDQIRIGNNVTIGALSFINKDIPDYATVYNEKKIKIVPDKSI